MLKIKGVSLSFEVSLNRNVAKIRVISSKVAKKVRIAKIEVV